jgi:2,4-dienoyl-CoA reductase (NADPH2)
VRAGRDVTLFEAGDTLGGALVIAAAAPNRGGWLRILDFYRAAVESGSVELRLGTAPTAEQLAPYDEIVVAVGGSEVLPDLDGAESARTVTAALAAGTGAIAGAERVAVVDDGFGWWPGVSAVELALAAGVKEIVVLTPSGAFAVGIPHESRIQLMQRLAGARIETRSFLLPVAFDGDGVVAQHRFSGTTERVDGDVVVVVGERKPAALDVDLGAGARVQAIGDTLLPRRVAHAIAEGLAAAHAIVAA